MEGGALGLGALVHRLILGDARLYARERERGWERERVSVCVLCVCVREREGWWVSESVSE